MVGYSFRKGHLVERAHELAQSDEFEYVYQIERQLTAEGHAKVKAAFSDNREFRHALRDEIETSRTDNASGQKTRGKI